MRARDVHSYGFVDWLYGPTALTPDRLAAMFDGNADAVALGA